VNLIYLAPEHRASSRSQLSFDILITLVAHWRLSSPSRSSSGSKERVYGGRPCGEHTDLDREKAANKASDPLVLGSTE
jgi:hypothetical protein